MEIQDKVIDVLKKLSEKEEVSVTDDLRDDLGLDSLDMVMLVIAIEDEFGIRLDVEDLNANEWGTVQAAIEKVKKNMGDSHEKESGIAAY